MKMDKMRTGSMLRQIKRKLRQISFKGSQQYWEKRYAKGGNSGAGSYGRLAQFKADTINDFIRRNDIKSVIEWGCGDGNQLALMQCEEYAGLDVAQSAVDRCKEKFKNDERKSFFCINGGGLPFNKKFDLALSLDVIYHLVEDEVYSQYMKNLFQSARQYVCIYSSDRDCASAVHVRERHFTEYVEKLFPEWVMMQKVENPYPFDPEFPNDTSLADFYFYCRT